MNFPLSIAMSVTLAASAAAAQEQPVQAKNDAGSPKRVLIVLTSHAQLGDTGRSTGFYLSEVTHPMAVFEAAGVAVDLASIQGGEPPVDGLDLDDPLNRKYWDSPAFRGAIRNTLKLDSVDASNYSAVFFAGGHGTMWDFPDNPAVQQLTRVIYESQGVVGAVCHGPAALVNVTLSDGSYLVAGRDVAAFTDAEEREAGLVDVMPFLLESTLEARGARHHGAENFKPKVVQDGRLVTGQNPASAEGVAEAIVALLAPGAVVR